MRALILPNGGSTFAERPEVAAPDARIIWHADVDPGTLRVIAVEADPNDPDAIDPAMFAAWLTIVSATDGCEHAVLSDGKHHIRLDVMAGSLDCGGKVVLHYHLQGIRKAQAHLLPLRRFLYLCRHRRFAPSLFPVETGVERGVLLLRVRDALDARASQRDIAKTLFGERRVEQEWRGMSESLRSRVRRLVADARRMSAGGYRDLFGAARRGPPKSPG